MLLRVSSVSAIIIMCFCSLAVSRKTRSIDMKISYKKLWVLLIQKDISKVTLRKEVGIAAGTMSKLNKGEEVALPISLSSIPGEVTSSRSSKSATWILPGVR